MIVSEICQSHGFITPNRGVIHRIQPNSIIFTTLKFFRGNFPKVFALEEQTLDYNPTNLGLQFLTGNLARNRFPGLSQPRPPDFPYHTEPLLLGIYQ